jgi:hypothetical protein
MSMNGCFIIVPHEHHEDFFNTTSHIDDLDYVDSCWVEQAWHMLAVLTDQENYIEGQAPHDFSATGSILVLNLQDYAEHLESLDAEKIRSALNQMNSAELEDIYWGNFMQNNADFVIDNFESLKHWLIVQKTKDQASDLYLTVV